MPVILAAMGTALLQAGAKILWSLATKEFAEWAVLKSAEVVVQHTKTPHDDEFLAAVKAANEKAKANG